MSIQRYRFDGVDLVKDEGGRWVKHDDRLAEVEKGRMTMANIAEIDDDGYGFSTGVAHYSIDGHVGQTDEALRADVVMIANAVDNAEKLRAEVERLEAIIERIY